MNKSCQSCGMPLRKDPAGGGSEADGSRSEVYCSYCYANGRFTQPDWTTEQMQSFVRAKMKEMGMPGFMGWFFVRGIPRLRRWRP